MTQEEFETTVIVFEWPKKESDFYLCEKCNTDIQRRDRH